MITTNCNHLKQFYQQVAGVDVDGTFPATGPFTTDSFEINHDSIWQVQIGLTGTDVDAVVKIILCSKLEVAEPAETTLASIHSISVIPTLVIEAISSSSDEYV